jgi:hypothetical protein
MTGEEVQESALVRFAGNVEASIASRPKEENKSWED